MQEKVGIVIALKAEADALLGRAISWDHHERKRCVLQVQDELQLVVTLAGIGTVKAEQAANDLILSGVKAMANVGLAGGLDPDLKAGQIVVASDVLQIEADESQGSWTADNAGAAQAHKVLGSDGIAFRNGTILTTQQAILTRDQKASLFKQTRALAVDMESAAVARVASRADIPFFGMRAVCDPAGVTVPGELFNCLDQNGNIRISGVLRVLARRPTLLGDMLRLGRTFSIARAALKRAWQVLVKNGLPQTLIGSR